MGEYLKLLFKLSRYESIGRRYFIVNGFDGALTMLGILLGFYQANNIPVSVIFYACLGATIALGASGISSAFISESAERRKSLRELESAMIRKMDDSAHAHEARLTPIIIALINGLSPVLICLIIMIPIWPSSSYIIPDLIYQNLTPIEISISFSLLVIFLLGVYLGRISGQFWLFSGFRTLLIALITGTCILLLTPR